MSIRRAASWPQPRQVSSVPRGARTGRAPGSGCRAAIVIAGILVGGRARPGAGRRVPSRHGHPRRAPLVEPRAGRARPTARPLDRGDLRAGADGLDRGDLPGRGRARRRGGPRGDGRASTGSSLRPAPTCASRTRDIAAAHAALEPGLLAGIREAIANSRLFNEAQVAETATRWRQEVRPGFEVGEQFAPIPSVGLFVPTGKASYPSVLCQIGTPAVVAGVPRIAVIVPPIPGGSGAVDPATLAVAHELGISEVYRANGPAGIAALTFGTATIPRVRKIVGPGQPGRDRRPGPGPALRRRDPDAVRPVREPDHRRRDGRPMATGDRPASTRRSTASTRRRP